MKKNKYTKFVPWILCVLLFGIIVGIFGVDSYFRLKFSDTKNPLIINDTTWIPIEGVPIKLMVLNDKTCKSCTTKKAIDAFKKNITPNITIEEVDIQSTKGKDLIQKFEVKGIPQYFFEKALASVKTEDGSKFVNAVPENILVLKDEVYHIQNGSIGLRTHKYLEAPSFKDINEEPHRGEGPIKVIEFTDFQCPYCKRLHDTNKETIDELIDQGKITYVIKDFPLSFHQEAVKYVHQAANCVLKSSDNKTYWQFKNELFDQTSQWSGKGEAAKTHFIERAKALNIDINTCMDDPLVKQEIEDDIQEGIKFGVTGTPALFIGKQFIPGIISSEDLRNAVADESK